MANAARVLRTTDGLAKRPAVFFPKQAKKHMTEA